MKKILKLSLVIALPISLNAQKLKVDNGNTGTTNQNNTKASAPKAELKPTVATNVANNDSLERAKELQKLNRPAKLAMADEKKADENKINRKYEYKGTKFKKVPLVGDLQYFGKNHPEVVKYTHSYINSRNKTLAAVRTRGNSGKLFPLMDKVLDKYQIPHELKYLAVIESALNNRALSPVGAYGPWQFMPSTGQMMGLTVTPTRDDRADWSRSTHAAGKYLTYLYSMMGDWLLVVASYNSGPRPVLNAIKKTGKRDFFSIKKYLPSETQNHVLAFIATATAFEYLPNYIGSSVPSGFDWSKLIKYAETGTKPSSSEEKPVNPLAAGLSKAELQKIAVVKITKPIDLMYLATILEADVNTLTRWNFDYTDYLLNFQPFKSSYHLKIPKNKLDFFLEKKDFIERESEKLGN